MTDHTTLMADFTFTNRYAMHLKNDKRRETWEESCERTRQMHLLNYEGLGIDSLINEACDGILNKDILGSQRCFQFAGSAIMKHNARCYNCWGSYMDRLRALPEAVYILLAGGGVGLSVQKHHVEKLPNLSHNPIENKVYTIPDSIEGWADALGVLLSSYFEDPLFEEYANTNVVFDYSQIRPRGSEFSHGVGTAPGPDGLRNSLEKVREVLDQCIASGRQKARPIDCYDILMHMADAVLSGGVRRSACTVIFSLDDEDMMKAKTGNWRYDNPQRARSNNSVLLLRGEVSREQFLEIQQWTKQYGEPGFVWSWSTELIFNPCFEINFYCYTKDGRSGWQACNLSTINCSKIKTPEDFYAAARLAAIMGTLQAGYDEFPYLGEVSEEIIRTEALIGVSMTGMMTAKDIVFNPEYQRKAAQIVKDTNKEVADLIGINHAARTTCVKPEGSSTTVLGLASFAGCHPGKGKNIIRAIQENKDNLALQYFKQINPHATEESYWSANKTDDIVYFYCESPKGSIQQKDIKALDFLELIKSTQINWVEEGKNLDLCIHGAACHNVSNTVVVNEDEWDDVFQYIYDNQETFAAVSLLSSFGDKDYMQAPFTEVLSEEEIISKYGRGALYTSGLIEEAEKYFGNLWLACDCALGFGEIISIKSFRQLIKQDFENDTKSKWKDLQLHPKSHDEDIDNYLLDTITHLYKKRMWVEKFNKFAKRYMGGDLRMTNYLLKDVFLNKKAWDLQLMTKPVDFSKMIEDKNTTNPQGEIACAGGACEI